MNDLINHRDLLNLLAQEGYTNKFFSPYVLKKDIFLWRSNDEFDDFQSVIFLERKSSYGSFSLNFGVASPKVRSKFSQLMDIEYFQSAFQGMRDNTWLHFPRLFSGGHVLGWPRFMIPHSDHPDQWLQKWNFAKDRLLSGWSQKVNTYEKYALFYLSDELGCEWRGTAVVDRLAEIVIAQIYSGYSPADVIAATKEVRRYFDCQVQNKTTLEIFVDQIFEQCPK